MYSPVLGEKMVRTLYRLKCSLAKPMTKVVENLLLGSIDSLDKGPVCVVCTQRNNNDCGNCYFSRANKEA